MNRNRTVFRCSLFFLFFGGVVFFLDKKDYVASLGGRLHTVAEEKAGPTENRGRGGSGGGGGRLGVGVVGRVTV